MRATVQGQCCVERATLEEHEEPEKDPKASVVTIAAPWHERSLPPPPPRIVTTGVPRTISNATTLPS